MRSRYSRKRYRTNIDSFPSDLIDDQDILFIADLASLNRSFVDHLDRKLRLDSSLLPPELSSIYLRIRTQFALIETSSDSKIDLFANFELESIDGEAHTRQLRGRVIDYLAEKRHALQSTRRVDFFVALAKHIDKLHRKHSENHEQIDHLSILRRICEEIVPETRKTVEKSSKIDKYRSVIGKSIDGISNLETLFPTPFKIVHPACRFDYESMNRSIIDLIERDDRLTIDLLSDDDDETPPPPPPLIDSRDNIIDLSTLYQPIIDDDQSFDRINNHSDRSEKSSIIEISDDEQESILSPPAAPAPPSSPQGEIDLRDKLLGQCALPPDHARLHPALLRDRQLRVELNAFLTVVNLAVRCWLRGLHALDRHWDRRLFRTIFVASVTIGLADSVRAAVLHDDDDDDRSRFQFDRLSARDHRVARSRLQSVQVPVAARRSLDRSLYSIEAAVDLERLARLALRCARSYRDTGAFD